MPEMYGITLIEKLKSRGFRSPYLRTYVAARINPVRFHRVRKGDAKPPMATGAALTRMAAAARKFDTGSVRESDLALVAAVASDGDGGGVGSRAGVAGTALPPRNGPSRREAPPAAARRGCSERGGQEKFLIFLHANALPE